MVSTTLVDTQHQVKHQHQRYLVQQALVEELEALLQDALACIQSADTDKAADKQLKMQGFKCSHQVYKAAFDHLQVAKCAQHLRLPAAAMTNIIISEASTRDSMRHVVGVTPQHLVQTQVPDLAAAQKGCQALIPELESRLQSKLQWLISLFDFRGAASDLPQQAAAQLAAVKGGHQELLEQWRQQQHASRDHLNTVQQAVATLTDLVEGHLLGLQQEADQVQQQWLGAHSQTLSAKLQVIEQQLLAMTYTGTTMPGLKKIDDQLTKAQRKLDARDQQVSAKLFRFDALGEEFVEMASRYRELQEDLDHANFTLQEFQKAANEQ